MEESNPCQHLHAQGGEGKKTVILMSSHWSKVVFFFTGPEWLEDIRKVSCLLNSWIHDLSATRE